MDYSGVLAERPSLLNNCVSALSDVNFHYRQEQREEAYIASEKPTKKHVRMLDQLALLFISQSTSEVCATTFIQQTNSATVYWAKSDPTEPTAAEREYFRNLVKCFERSEILDSILKICVKHCFRKVVTRCRKAAKLFSWTANQTNILNLDDQDSFNISIQQRLRSAACIFPQNTMSVAMDNFLRGLANVSEQTSVDQLCQIIIFADNLTPQAAAIGEESTKSPILNPIQLRRMTKIAVYRRIIGHVLEVCQENNIKKFRVLQVCPPKLF